MPTLSRQTSALLSHVVEQIANGVLITDRQGFIDDEDVGIHRDRRGERETRLHARGVGAKGRVDHVLELAEGDDILHLGLDPFAGEAETETA